MNEPDVERVLKERVRLRPGKFRAWLIQEITTLYVRQAGRTGGRVEGELSVERMQEIGLLELSLEKGRMEKLLDLAELRVVKEGCSPQRHGDTESRGATRTAL